MSAIPAPQLTLKAILLSIVLTVILASANAYVGLFAGLTVATAIPAAVISMAVLPLFGRPNILENNIVATGASAGSSIAAGAIFTLPALILLHHWSSFDYWWTLAIAGLGGLLGVLFSVPLRRTLIIDQKLQFPEGVAAAEVLKVGANPGIGARFLGIAALVGGTLPSGMIAIGAVIGALIIVLDLYLKRRGSRWSAPVLAVAVGIYLPLDVSTPILGGGIVAELVGRWHLKHNPGGDHDKLAQNGMLFAAGLITGEALVGIFIAMCIWISRNPEVLTSGAQLPGGKWWAAALLLGVCYWVFRAGTPRHPA